jgi:hypothetical protein
MPDPPRWSEIIDRLQELPDDAVYVRLHTRVPLRVVADNERKMRWTTTGGAEMSWRDWSAIKRAHAAEEQAIAETGHARPLPRRPRP